MVLFSPAFMVYTLCFLLLSNICTIIFVPYPSPSVTPSRRAIAFIGCSLITLHHILVTFPWRIRALALTDLVLTVIEIGFFARLVSLFWYIFFTELGLLALLLSALFRASTIMRGKDGLLRQQFSFLGGCTSVHPPYTPLSTLLGRGEAASIVFARAVIISQSVCAPSPSSSRSSLSFDFIWVVPAAIRARVHGNNDVSFPTVSWQAGRVPQHLIQHVRFESSRFCKWKHQLNSFGTTTALLVLEYPYRWPMLIPADIHWLRRIHTDVIKTRTDPGSAWSEPLWYGDLDEEAGEDAGVMAAATTRGASLTRLTLALVNEYGAATKLLQDTAAATVLSGMASFGGLHSHSFSLPPPRSAYTTSPRPAFALRQSGRTTRACMQHSLAYVSYRIGSY
ncbi:hypothetical protein B0H16DRAFT_1734412 [Mycena metata]|uniref:Transmembrane protein n=1 Tax=Mycena metata TaxID=1033252 RepID=A0AAD7HW18_9AGAR|nr:hypothetical protein B0H16DRAFT_1734412 [Mycena metata]